VCAGKPHRGECCRVHVRGQEGTVYREGRTASAYPSLGGACIHTARLYLLHGEAVAAKTRNQPGKGLGNDISQAPVTQRGIPRLPQRITVAEHAQEIQPVATQARRKRGSSQRCSYQYFAAVFFGCTCPVVLQPLKRRSSSMKCTARATPSYILRVDAWQ